jgi:predicted anti-sigma-YlaC factor YlaD
VTRGDQIRFALDHRWTQRHVSDGLDGELSRTERDRLARHEAVCPECRGLLASLRRLLWVLDRAATSDAVEPTPAIAIAVSARLHQSE